MRILTIAGDVALIRFLWPPGKLHRGRQAARKVCEDAKAVLLAAQHARAVEPGMWIRETSEPMRNLAIEGGFPVVEVTPERVIGEDRSRLEAIMSDFAVAISGAVRRGCEVRWK